MINSQFRFLLFCLVGSCTSEVLSQNSHETFEREIKNELSVVDDGRLNGLKVLYVSGDFGPWLDTGMKLARGEKITTIVRGRRWLSLQHEISFEPEFALWKRLCPTGDMFRGPGIHTFDV